MHACSYILDSHTAGKGSKTRSPQSMVHNPIYSGPDYESIHPQYETLQLVPHHMAHSTPGAECGNQILHLQS